MFTLGNFITFGIVVLLLVFYRQLDKRNRTLDKVRKYADHLKDELTAFVTEKENAVKDYSVSLDVEQKSAKELMKRVQITDAELAEKAKAIAKIDERITVYDSSLEELVRMTARVQENLTRLREEAAFTESVNKKITDAQNKFNAIERQMAELRLGFERENSTHLEKLAGEILADVKSSVAELKTQSQSVERYVSEQCAAMEKAEHIRATNLQRDMNILNRTLKTVTERAANKADTLEIEILENLKAESEKRIQDLKSSIEETFRDSQAKAQEQLDKVQSIAEENQSMWEADRIEFEAREQSRQEKLRSDIDALSTMLTERTEALKKVSADDEARSANVRAYIVSQNDALEQKFNETKQHVDETVSLLETRIKNVSGEAEQRVLEKADERFGNWQHIIHEADANLQKMLSSLESSSIDIQDHFTKETGILKQKLKDIERQIETEIADLRDQIEKTSEESQTHVAEEAEANLEQLLRIHEEQNDRLVRSVQDMEIKAESIKSYFDDKTAVVNKKFSDTEIRMEEAVTGFEDRLQRTAAEAERKVLESADIRLEDWKKAAVDADVKLRDLLRELETSAEMARADFDVKEAHITQKLTDISLQTERAIDGLKENIARASESVEARIVDEADVKLQQWLAVSEDHNGKAELILEELERTTEQAKAAFDIEVAAMDKRLDEAKVRADHVVASWEADTELRLRKMDKKLADTETYAEHTILDSEKRIAAAMMDTELSALGKVDAKLTEYRKSFERQMADRDKVVEEEAVQSRQRFEDLAENFNEIKERLTKEIEEIEDRQASVQEKIDMSIEKIEDAIRQAVEATDEKAESAAKNRLLQWQEASKQAMSQVESQNSMFLTQFNQDYEQTLAEAEKLKSSLIAQFNQTYEKASAEAMERTDNLIVQFKKIAEKSEEQGEGLIAQWKQALAEASMQNAAELSAIETNFTEVKHHIADEIANAELRLHSIQEKMDETVHRIEYVIKDAISETDTQAVQIADDRLAQWKQASEQAVASAEEQTNNFIVQFKQTYEQAMVTAEDQASSLIDQFKKDVDTSVEQNKTLLEQWKTASETLIIQDRAQLTALKDSWNQTKNQWSREIIDSENRLKFLGTQIKESSAHIGSVMQEATEHAEATAHNQADKRIEEWQRAVQQAEEQAQQILVSFETSLSSARQNLANERESMEERFKSIGTDAQDMIDKLEQQLYQSAEDIEQRILDSTDAKFEEYRKAQFEQFQRFESLADDAAMLDEELRRYLVETKAQVKDDFSAFEQASARERSAALVDFTSMSNSLKVEMENIEKELAALKETAYNNVSEKLHLFENDFSLNLSKRSDEIDKRLDEWRRYLDSQLIMLAEDAESKWKTIETSYTEKLTAKLAENNNSWLMELEKLKSETGDFEESIRVQMKIADDSLVSLKEQFIQDMEDARSSAESALRAEIGRHDLAISDTLKQSQRDMSAKLKRLQDDIETRSGELVSLFETSRHNAEEWKAVFNNQLHDLEIALEETRKRSKDLVVESNERLSSVRASLEDVRTEADVHRAELFSRIDEQARSMDAAIKEADRHIKDFAHQTSLFERADTLKMELEHHIEDLHSDLDRIDQHKTESADLEKQFIRIKRLEDEVNAKMTRFLSERHRIEQMETEFNRLLQTSKAVDEKLAQLSASDDTLQAMQVQIRKFDDALDASEEKFKRIERKNQTLDITNEGIDRNFKILQESEQTAQRIGEELARLSTEMGIFRTNIGYIAKDSEKAKSAVDKIATLDTTLSEIDQRIATVQASREWLARLETRLEELNKQAQDQVKLIGNLMKDNGVPLKSAKGAPPIGTRENVIKLSQQGWTVDEIARAQKLGRGEVELILELAHNG
jgi:hypothetical protein